MFETFREKQQVSETLDAVLTPLIPFMDEMVQDRLRRAMEVIHDVPIKEDI